MDKKFYKWRYSENFEDGHNRLETPVPFPNTEVKLPMFMTLVPDKVQNHEAVFHILYIFIVQLLEKVMKEISKTEAVKIINEFFKEIKTKSPREINKIRKLAMSYKIPLKEKRKSFCKYCLKPFSDREKIRIKNNAKNIECLNCKKISRWKI